MSPETVGNKPYNYKSDVWALGCILYEICSLKHPFNANDLRGLFVKIMRGVFPPIPFQYSSKLRNLVAKMLTVSPSKRPTIADILRYPFVAKQVQRYISSPQSPLFQKEGHSTYDLREINNFQIQLQELGIPTGNLSTPVLQAKERQQSDAQQNMKDPKSQIAQLQRMEKEKERVQQELEKLKEKKQQQREIIQKDNIKKKCPKEDDYKQKRLGVTGKQQLSPAAEKPHPQAQNMKPKPSAQKFIDQDNKKLEKVKQDKKYWEQKVKQLEQQLSESLRRPAEEKQYPSQAERVKLEKQRKREEEENKRKGQLQQAAKNYHQQRVDAKQRQYAQFHAKPLNAQAREDEDNEEFEVHVTQRARPSLVEMEEHSPFSLDEENIEEDIHENEFLEEDDDDDDDIIIKEYEKNLKDTKRQIEELRTSLTRNFGEEAIKTLQEKIEEEEDDEEEQLGNTSVPEEEIEEANENPSNKFKQIGPLAEKINYL